MNENSPTFQRWEREFRGAQVPKGRLKPATSAVPSGLNRLRVPNPNVETLGYSRSSLRDEAYQKPSALDEDVRAPYMHHSQDGGVTAVRTAPLGA